MSSMPALRPDAGEEASAEGSAKPRVSVIVAVHNGEKEIGDCLRSLLGQTYRDFEIIVVNDGSTDGTKDEIARFESGRVRAIHLTENRGVSAARNAGFRAARGELIAILDADDVALPDRLREQTAYLGRHPEVGLVGSYVKLRSEMGDAEIAERPLAHEEIVRAASWSCPAWNTTAMFRAAVLQKTGGYPEHFRHGEDYRFLVQVMKEFKVANIPEVHVIKKENRKGLTFRISPWAHFKLGLSHRLFAVRTLGAGPEAYLKAVLSSFGILAVRILGLNRESLKKQRAGRGNR